MDRKTEYMDTVRDGIRNLTEKRYEYRQEIANRTRRKAHNDDFMVEVYKVLLADIEWQLNNNKE